MTNPPTLIPQAFWFRYSVACPYIGGIPVAAGRRAGPLLDLPDSCVLPRFGDAQVPQPPFAEVRAAWNAEGLAFAVTAPEGEPRNARSRRAGEVIVPAGFELWIDTRDTRDIHRASRFCHNFGALVEPLAQGGLESQLVQGRIHRAQGDPPAARKEHVRHRASRVSRDKGWRLELFLMAQALHGFDPVTSRRLGFMLHITDPERGDQYLSVGREFPIAEDPSLWATLELVGGP